jgi:hypothetical protein
MSNELLSKLRQDLALIERLISEATYRALDASAAIDDAAIKRVALELDRLKHTLSDLRDEIAASAAEVAPA